MVQATNPDGLSVIVLSYERIDALEKNLLSILMQEMDGIPLEIILVNNSNNITLKPSRFTKIGRILRDNPQIKVMNSLHNWQIFIRYGIAYITLYDTIMYIDDDIHLKDEHFLRDMYRQKQALGTYDLLSCWNTIWSEWSDDVLKQVPVNLWNASVNGLVKTDTCGPGISMFSRQLLFDSRAQELLIAYYLPDAVDLALGLLTNLLYGGTTYYFPAYNRADFHEQHKQKALHSLPNFISDRMKLYKRIWKLGYVPVLERYKDTLDEDSPEMQIIRASKLNEQPW